MEEIVFKFANTFWKQIAGTSMGTPCAFFYVYLFFGWHEGQTVLRKYTKCLCFFKQSIDVIIVIWNHLPNSCLIVNSLHKDINNVSNLEWTTTCAQKSVYFLDVTLTIELSNRITSKTFQKDMNIFLYIPAHSSHPPGNVRSVVFSLLGSYCNHKPTLMTTSILLNFFS